MIVVDSNVLAARNLTGAQTGLARQVEERDPIWIVPPLWRYEFQNILAKAVWARQIAPNEALGAWARVSAQLVDNEHEPTPEKVLDLSARYRITAYDANFIALAIEMGVTCVTEDGELQEKFPSVAVSMRDFVKQDRAGGEVREVPVAYRTGRRK